MLSLMGSEKLKNLHRIKCLETKRERREFQRRVVYFCSGFLAGAIVTIIAFAPMIRK